MTGVDAGVGERPARASEYNINIRPTPFPVAKFNYTKISIGFSKNFAEVVVRLVANTVKNRQVADMGRLHSKGKGISRSANPYKRSPPQWLKTSPLDVEEHVCKLAKKGLTPSQIGVILRDSSGIPAVKSVTGSKILRLLKKNGLAPEIPEDLYMLIKKAVSVRKHMERNRADKDSKFRLILIESRIHRLARYYRTTRKLHAAWK